MTSSANEIQVPQGTTVALKGVRRAAARQMVAAWQAPAFHLTIEVDMTNALTVKTVSSESTVTDLLISAVAIALQDHPGLNAHYSEDGVTSYGEINIGLAVATDAGLTVPVIHGASGLALPGIAQKRRELVDRARAKKLGMGDITGGTFTISNLGMLGIDRFDAILNVPQVAILAVASARQRFVMHAGTGQWRPIAELSLTCDHRAVDGYMGALFLKQLKELLEAPIPAL
ncbi:2-oxo acid dehydrogenase subunit E2 [Arthrobacter globiformis]|uniref:2-oxo acid dehydrogenase subunit E2 n=1 Tax=Arthrobacter globiformis TaxID=1665 RepID=UPI002784CD8B|nr:2-oxo acid dehydrogenase subunit E2 [Arthrobacter globiformis]MDQ0864539.1 pyruvate dehydrogenase E2 component (dihydrolipoamide acetyltransferase) [Arthrobacter globiformis]